MTVSASVPRICELFIISVSPITTRSGFFPRPLLVSSGSSAITVAVEVTIASDCERISATSARASSPVIHLELPSVAVTLPSMVEAIFQVILGRFFSILVSQARFSWRAWTSPIPDSTSIPDFCNLSVPPAATGFGSLTANTTFLIPEPIIASTQGGVFPW